MTLRYGQGAFPGGSKNKTGDRNRMITSLDNYRGARDELLALRGEHAKAVEVFRWPDLGERFNWAVDWFDNVARGQDRAALILVEEDGSSTTVSYEQMRRRSNQVATWLREQGVRKGDPGWCSCSATRLSCGRRCWR